MDGLNQLDQFDLGTDGDRHEQEFWPLLSGRFPSYEVLWRRLIVPLTNRVDPAIVHDPMKRIRFRPRIPKRYEQAAMAHYSVFYFLGRAVKRVSEEETALEYPEDVFFLLHSVADNFKKFLQAMDGLEADCGRARSQPTFAADVNQFPKGFDPFTEIRDYRDTFLHNAVIGRGVEIGKIYIPRWNLDKSASPLERAKESWRAAEQLSRDDLIGTSDLFERLIQSVCCTLETTWRRAIAVVTSQLFEQKMVRITKLSDYLPLGAPPVLGGQIASASGSCISSLGSNTTLIVPAASREH
jgi:hypothetical protein